MPKYWGKQIFAHGRFPEMGKKQKTEERERKKERLNDGNNNGQATHGARKHAWRTQAAWANILWTWRLWRIGVSCMESHASVSDLHHVGECNFCDLIFIAEEDIDYPVHEKHKFDMKTSTEEQQQHIWKIEIQLEYFIMYFL